MNEPAILNIDTLAQRPERGIYVGRGSVLGNPFAIGQDGDRDEVIARYRQHLASAIRRGDPDVLTALYGIRPDTPLLCHCAPRPCHAEVIREFWAALARPEAPARKVYAGIGARATPPVVMGLMRRIAERLSARGWRLRSGAANGADSAFAAGAAPELCDEFLPWPGFNGSASAHGHPSSLAARVASSVHPAWPKLGRTPRLMMARNSHQVLGEDLMAPAGMVICWTPDGAETEGERTRKTGGTGQAVALADRWGVPVINLSRPGALDRIAEVIEQVEKRRP